MTMAAAMIEVVPLEKSNENFEFSLAAKKEALGPDVVSRWGWDDHEQREIHARNWTGRCFFRIEREGEAAGTVSVEEAADHVKLAEFYILPAFQRQGIVTGETPTHYQMERA